jgi:hypothetical protein
MSKIMSAGAAKRPAWAETLITVILIISIPVGISFLVSSPTNPVAAIDTAIPVTLKDGDYSIYEAPSPEAIRQFLQQNNQELVGAATLYQLHIENGVPQVRVWIRHRPKE